MLNLKDRIKIAKTSTHRTNCHGTGLYLVGEQERDAYTDFQDALKILAQLKPTDRLNLGNLVTWTCKINFNQLVAYGLEVSLDICLNHTAIVTSIDPVLFTHRDGLRGPIVEAVPISEIEGKRGYGLEDRKIYAPRTKIEL